MEYTVLIVDDDEDILAALEIYLTGEGYHICKADNGEKAIEIARQNTLHLILLDVMMPGTDGIQAAVKIRTFSNVPIIFLSAKAEDTDRVLGLNMGADDYIAKPFNPIELFARIKAALRRYARLGGMKEENSGLPKPGILQTGGLVLDNNKKLVSVDGEQVSLTAVEFHILQFLMSNLDYIFSSKQIYEAVWNEPAFDVGKTVSVHIRHIREKIELNPKDPHYLKVVYGLGYKVVKYL